MKHQTNFVGNNIVTRNSKRRRTFIKAAMKKWPDSVDQSDINCKYTKEPSFKI